MRTQNHNRRRSLGLLHGYCKKGTLSLRARRLRMEMLEHRLVLSTFLVTNTADSGDGSLRWAIDQANATDEADTIEFNIPIPTSVRGRYVRDPPVSALPALSDTSGGTTIDGRTQTAFTGDTNPLGPEIVLDGSAITVAASGLHLSSDDNQVHGLNIQRFSRNGILMEGDDNLVTGCFIGTNATGTEVAKNVYYGIAIQDASGNLIGGTSADAGNVISGNSVSIWINGDSSTGNVLQGNRIGTDPTGSIVLTNGWGTGTNDDGIVIDAGSNNLIGGTAPGAGNLISGFWEQAIWIRGSATGNLMQGNRIGTNGTGTEMLDFDGRGHSSLRGILIEESANNLVGSGNLVAGNFFGVVIDGAGATGNVVQGSLIGTDVTGTNTVRNVRDGIHISQGASNNLIGGGTEAERISSPATDGMGSTSSKRRATPSKATTSAPT